MAVMIGIDPHKGSHTAVAIGPSEEPLGRQRVGACPGQAQQLLAWAAAWPERTWAVEGATGLGRMLARQLAAAGEQVLDIQPKLAARVRLLEAGDVNKNDPNDARSVAVAALRSRAPRPVAADDHAAVLKIWSLCRYRHKDHYPNIAVMPIPVAGCWWAGWVGPGYRHNAGRGGVKLSFSATGEDREMDDLQGVRVAGPLAPYVRGFAGELARLGYRSGPAQKQLQLAAQLSGWLADAGLGAADLDAAAIGAYLTARRAAGYGEFVTPRALVPLLGYLRRLGVAPLPEAPVPQTLAEELLDGYRRWLLAERGLRLMVARGYLNAVRPFVTAHAARGLSGLRELAAGDVTAFLLAESRRLGPKTLQRVATALRSLLRFWHLQGLTGGPLDRAVPKTANRRPGLPRPAEPGQVAALLASCDRETAAGQRDLAMLILLARLGLRAGEVAALTLDDIDWRAAEISIAGKGGRRDRLPLPADAGQAIAAYLLHGRPVGALDRSVFIRDRAPRSGLTPGAVTQVVAAAARRAGLGTIYAHRLRHAAATAVLAEGGSLAEIGQVLRHRRAVTTAAYTKVNIEALRALARPWPGASS